MSLGLQVIVKLRAHDSSKPHAEPTPEAEGLQWRLGGSRRASVSASGPRSRVHSGKASDRAELGYRRVSIEVCRGLVPRNSPMQPRLEVVTLLFALHVLYPQQAGCRVPAR